MANETRLLAEYASELRFSDLPANVVERAKDCVIDSVGAILCGHGLPWSEIVIAQAAATSAPGPSHILGTKHSLTAQGAALANGVLAHSFELDCLRDPSSGVHPGSVIVPAALAAVQATGGNGRDLIAAVAVGVEAMFRIGLATKNKLEEHGFHAPSLNGNFGAAISVGHVFKLNKTQMTNALGIAGSLGGGLLEFVKAGQGGWIKRLHLGRAAANGVFAADLAQRGFEAPHTILEGKAGYLAAYAPDPDPSQLTSELGKRFETMTICFKHYSCHITAHTPVTAIREMQAEQPIPIDAIESITVEGNHKLVHGHDIKEPSEIMLAQYSSPFCVALTLCTDPRDPDNFSDKTLNDPTIRALCRRVNLIESKDPLFTGRTSRVTINFKDGTTRSRTQKTFPGMPSAPLTPDQRDAKFKILAKRFGGAADEMLAKLQNLETMDLLAALR